MRLVLLCVLLLGYMPLSLGLSSLALHVLFDAPFSWDGAVEVCLIAVVAILASFGPLGFGKAELLEYTVLFFGLAGARVALSVLVSQDLSEISVGHWLVILGGAGACALAFWYPPKRAEGRRNGR